MKNINRIEINNATKVITVTNSVFESLTVEEETKIEKYERRGYSFEIVDDKAKKVSANRRLNKVSMKNAMVKNSVELEGLSETEKVACIDIYKALEKISFPTAKSYFIELQKVIANKSERRHKDVASLNNYYKELKGLAA